QGVLIVQEAAAEEEMQMEQEVMMEEEMQMEEEVMMEEDVVLMVTITESAMGDGTHVYLEFSEIHVNYEMIGMQNGEEIFTITGHAMEMTSDHHIDAVGSDENPIDIEIVSLGIGPPDAEDDWTEPTGTVATTQIVPEFGTIAMMVLAVAIISIVAVTAKSRVIPRF
ncbi:MAG: PEFG-CTERM sorting domain-containing protein, partial [Nitrosopumilus sp.]